ncbi:hypothetical protein GCM10023063_17840 [Arthrobacter methylotrophus]
MIRLDTLNQSEHWVDRHGEQHTLSHMDRNYLTNVLWHLRKMAPSLYERELWRRSELVFIAGFDPVEFPDLEYPRSEDSAEEWLNNTLLIKAITVLLDGN